MRTARAARVVVAAVGVLAALPAFARVRTATLAVTATVVRSAEIALPRAGAPARATLAGASAVPVQLVDGAPASLVVLERPQERSALAARAPVRVAPRS
jgi:hypothetical protein